MVTNNNPTHLGVGLYSFPDAARLLKITTGRLRRWVCGPDQFLPHGFAKDEDTLTFADLMEIHFVTMYLREGVKLHVIKKSARAAAQKYQTGYPFSVERFDTDGTDIFATLISGETNHRYVEDLARGQLVFEKVVRPFFLRLEFNQDSQLVRYWPDGKRGRILLDPARKFGKPIEIETGIPTRAIFNALQAGGGQSPVDVARWLGISKVAVMAAAKFERSLGT